MIDEVLSHRNIQFHLITYPLNKFTFSVTVVNGLGGQWPLQYKKHMAQLLGLFHWGNSGTQLYHGPDVMPFTHILTYEKHWWGTTKVSVATKCKQNHT